MKAFLDVETTGFEPGQIAQLAYIITDDDLNFVKAENYYFSVDSMPRAATEVHGLTKAKLKKLSDGKEFYHSAPQIAEDLKNCDIICHNLDFDSEFLDYELRSCAQYTKLNYSACTMQYFTDICQLRPKRNGKWKWPKLNEVLSHLKITEQEVLDNAKRLFECEDISFHDARFDVSAVYLICSKAMTKEQLAEMQAAYIESIARREVAVTARSISQSLPAPKNKKRTTWMGIWLIVSIIIIPGLPWVGILSLAACSFVAYRRKKASELEHS